MEKRVLLAVVLSFIVLYGYQALFPPPDPRQRPSTPARSTTTTAPSAASVQPAQPGQPAEAVATAEPLVHDPRERDIVVENREVQGIFTTRGGVLKHWRLKRYLGSDGQPLDLVPKLPPDAIRPFTLTTGDQPTDATLARALFKPSADSVDATSSGDRLVFEYRDAAGLEVRKEFTLVPDRPFIFEFSASVSKNGKALNPTVHWGPALGTGVVSSGMTYAPSPQPIFYRDRDVTRVGFGDIAAQGAVEGTVGFGGVDDHYFLSAAMPKSQPVRAAVRSARRCRSKERIAVSSSCPGR